MILLDLETAMRSSRILKDPFYLKIAETKVAGSYLILLEPDITVTRMAGSYLNLLDPETAMRRRAGST